MTTVPFRNGTLGPTIASLRAQTRLPDEIRIYLGPGCAEISDEGTPSVVCVQVEDRGPVTKLSAVADPEVPPDAIVVTVDDDIVFHREWLATLLHFAEEHPGDAVGMAGWDAGILLDTGRYERASGPCDVIEGFGGVAYRKWFFGADVLDPPAAMKWVDDVWISSYLHRAGVIRRVVPGESRMIDISRSTQTGIHTRPDFNDLNKQAARIARFRSDDQESLRLRREAALAFSRTRKP